MTTFNRPPGRYDDPRPIPRSLAVALAVLLGTGLLAGAFAAYQRTADRVQYTVRAYEVVDDRVATISFEVHEDDPVRCRVHALDRDKTEVGTLTLEAAPDVVTKATLATTARAATVEVVTCRPVVQP
jgi:hypothetical protein